MSVINSSYKRDRHPINSIMRITELVDAVQASLYFSIYEYEPQSLSDRRREFCLPFSELSSDWLEEKLLELKPNEELALNSLVELDSKVAHIPMIDVGGRTEEINNVPFIADFSDHWRIEFELYSSGRSYHMYGDRLIDKDLWYKFMGSLLLLNLPGRSKLIDTRWVGHRIMAGYSALRWSCNTSQYKRFPARTDY